MANTIAVSCLFALSLLSHAFATSMFGLHVSGNQILNQDGLVVRLLGVNRSGMEYMCAKAGAFYDGPMDQASVTAMLSWNINTVRLPLNEDCWLAINGVNPAFSGTNYINAVKTYVDLLTANGLAVVIDLHWTSDGDSLALNQMPMPDIEHSPAFWTSVASTFKSYSNVIFDLFNEPIPDNNSFNSDTAWECWLNGGSVCGLSYNAAGMQVLLNTVRATGATNIVNVDGIAWGNSLGQWLAYKPVDPLSNLMAGVHIYDFDQCNTTACFDRYVAPVALEVPVLIGEFGQDGCAHDFIDVLMAWADNLGINYLAWSWGNFDCSSAPALITSYDGTPTNFGIGLRNHLATFPATLGSYTASGSSSSSSTSATSTSTSTSSTGTSPTRPSVSTSTSTSTSTSISTSISTITSASSTGTAPGRPSSTSTSASSSGSGACAATVSQTVASTWSGGGQVTIVLVNHGSHPISSVSLTIGSGMAQSWNLLESEGAFALPSWAYPLAPGATFSSAGYIYNGPMPSVSVSVSC